MALQIENIKKVKKDKNTMENVMKENIVKNNSRTMKFLAMVDEQNKEEKLSSTSLSKIAIVNLTNEDIDDKLSHRVCEYKCSATTKKLEDDEILKSTKLLCFMYIDKVDLNKDIITKLIDKAREDSVDIFMLCIKEKQIDKVVMTINEISYILCETGTNIDINALKGEDVVDAFVITKRDNVDLKKCYIETLENHLAKIQKLSQVDVCVYCGNNTKLCDMLFYIDIQNKLAKDVDVILGTDINDLYSGVCKVVVMFQGCGQKTQKRQALEERINLAHQNYQKKDTKATQQTQDVYDKQFYESQIKRFCKFKEITTPMVQRFFVVGYPKAVQMLDDWCQKGYIERNDHCWEIIDSKSIMKNLKEIFC